MLVTSLKTNKEIAELSSNPWLIKQGLTLEHYKYLFTETPFLTFFKKDSYFFKSSTRKDSRPLLVIVAPEIPSTS